MRIHTKSKFVKKINKKKFPKKKKKAAKIAKNKEMQ